MVVLPSVASADPFSYEAELRRLGAVPYLHFDMEDGNFLPNVTFGMKTVRAILDRVSARADAHLLVANPYDYIEPLAACGVAAVAVHYEAVAYPKDILGRIRRHGMRAGLALNFKTGAEALCPFADAPDYVLVMTAEPDDAGQIFSPAILEKTRALRALLPERVGLWADGDIRPEALPELCRNGVDTVVMGRAIWGSADPAAAYQAYTEAC